MSNYSYKVLFVCLGNICRSPLAKGVFSKLLEERDLTNRVLVDSCGTGAWHTGSSAHSETIRTAQKIGIQLASHRARQIAVKDFDEFDLMVAMDRSNYRDICTMRKPREEQLILLRSLDPEAEDLDVPDPFSEGPDGFLITQDIVYRGCQRLVNLIEDRLKNETK